MRKAWPYILEVIALPIGLLGLLVALVLAPIVISLYILGEAGKSIMRWRDR